MPYFISNTADGCAGWATVKADGEVLGCHVSKGAAINQMVALSLAEGIEPGGERNVNGDTGIIVDIDDTLIHMGEPMQDVIDYVNSLEGKKFIITARPIAQRAETVKQLEEFGVSFFALYMKDTDEPTPAFKKRIAETLLKRYNIVLAIDNDADNLAVYDDLGIDTENPAMIGEEMNSNMAKNSEFAVRDAGDWDMLNERQQEQAENTAELVLEYGQFDQSSLSNGAHYAPGADNPFKAEGLVCYNCVFYNEKTQQCAVVEGSIEPEAVCKLWVIPEEKIGQPAMIDESGVEEMAARAINQDAPEYMREAAKRGLVYYADGKGGAGLVERTIREARLMADGQVSDDKWIRIAAWIARHLSDLDSPDADPNSEGYPSAGVVAHLLWGSGANKSDAERTLKFAESVVERIRAEERSAKNIHYRSVGLLTRNSEGQAVETKVERRVNHVEFDVRQLEQTGDKMTFTGYAAVFDSPSEPLPFTEYIRAGAFKRSLKSRNEIKLFMNHNTDVVLGSTRAGTLKLTEDSKGLLAEAELPPTTAGNDLSILMQRGDVNSMSFGFSVPSGGDKWSADGSTRELRQVRLHEVSIVTGFPAYEATSASVRSLDILATRTNVDVVSLSDAITKLEAGETLDAQHADLIGEVVSKLRAQEVPVENLLELKRKQLDLMLKSI